MTKNVRTIIVRIALSEDLPDERYSEVEALFYGVFYGVIAMLSHRSVLVDNWEIDFVEDERTCPNEK